MRELDAISPSSFFLYQSNRRLFYVQYLSDKKEPRGPQTRPMAVGSSFDAHVKCAIHKDLQVEKPFNLRELHDKQVEVDQEEMFGHGAYILQEYKDCGAYAMLLEDLQASQIEPMFEFDIRAKIKGVPVKGFPDAFYVNSTGTHTVVDWKVNGYESGTGRPKPHYIKCHRTGKSHRKAVLGGSHGVPINVAAGLEDTDKKWAFQQMIYALALGAPIGSSFICTLEQVCGTNEGLDFYTYRAPVSKDFQNEYLDKLVQMWEEIQTGHIFSDLSKEGNDALMEELDGPFRSIALKPVAGF